MTQPFNLFVFKSECRTAIFAYLLYFYTDNTKACFAHKR